jgi:hypothetical protein
VACARPSEWPQKDDFATRKSGSEWLILCPPCRAKHEERAARRLGRRAAEIEE